MTKNFDSEKYVYSGYGLAFELLLPNGKFTKNNVNFGADNNLSARIGKRKNLS